VKTDPNMHLPEPAARSVLAVQAFEAGGDSPVWTADDRAWATRTARDAGAATLAPAAALAERARHALQRLLPRQPALATLLKMGLRPAPWVLLLPLVAFIAGVAVDGIGSSQRINLLAPPVWAVVVWNLAVYAGLALPGAAAAAVPRGLRALLARWAAPGLRLRADGHVPALQAYAAAWARAAAPAALARGALLLHVAAAALALGMVAGLYLRGLVLDYRAGWQSTFLDPAAVRGVLALLLAPASALTGIGVPDAEAIAALRVGPDAVATAPAAPWLHLYAATLALAVVLPRTLLALAAAWRMWHCAQRVPLPLHEPYFQRLLHDLQGRAPLVQVLPHGAAPSPQATLGLRDWLQQACGDGLQLRMAPATAYGSEEQATTLLPEPGATLRVLLADLGSTPEDDSHGRLLQSLQAQAAVGAPLLVLTDEAAFRQRFAQLPARLAERRAAWQAFAHARGAGWVGVDLQQPDLAGAQALLQAALQGIQRPDSAPSGGGRNRA
jgi:hypothetical protein